MQGNKLTYTGVKSQINNDHPIFVGLERTVNGATSGHVNVIRGYDTSYNGVLFIDPADGDYHGQNYTDYSAGVHWDGYYWLGLPVSLILNKTGMM